MSTRIEISTGADALIRDAQIQQATRRRVFAEEQARVLAAEDAEAAVAADRAAGGLQGEDGRVRRPARNSAPRVTPKPTANRQGTKELSIAWVYYGDDGDYWMRGAKGGDWVKVGRWDRPFWPGSMHPEGYWDYTVPGNPEWLPGDIFLEVRTDGTFDGLTWYDGESSSELQPKWWAPTYGDPGWPDPWYTQIAFASFWSGENTFMPLAYAVKRQSPDFPETGSASSCLVYSPNRIQSAPTQDKCNEFPVAFGTKAGVLFYQLGAHAGYWNHYGTMQESYLSGGDTINIQVQNHLYAQGTNLRGPFRADVYAKAGAHGVTVASDGNAAAARQESCSITSWTEERDVVPSSWTYAPLGIDPINVPTIGSNYYSFPRPDPLPGKTPTETIQYVFPVPLGGRLTDIWSQSASVYPTPTYTGSNRRALRANWTIEQARATGRLNTPPPLTFQFASVTDDTYYDLEPWELRERGFNSYEFYADLDLLPATPAPLMQMQLEAGLAPGAALPVPPEGDYIEGWGIRGWKPVRTEGGFAVPMAPGEWGGSQSYVQRVMDTGYLLFEHNDGRRERVEIGGSAYGPTDAGFQGINYGGQITCIVATNWGQAAKVKALAAALGYT